MLHAALGCGLAYEPVGSQDNGTPNIQTLTVGLFIVLVIVVQACFQFAQNVQSSRLLKSFAETLPTVTTVVRGGQNVLVPIVSLVVGDVVVLRAGDAAPADLRVVHASSAKLDKSSLTGESDPVPVLVDLPAAEAASAAAGAPRNKGGDYELLTAGNLVLLGTRMVEGQATCVVFATGDRCCMADLLRFGAGASELNTTLHAEINRVVFLVLGECLLLVTLYLATFYGSVRDEHPGYLSNSAVLINILTVRPGLMHAMVRRPVSRPRKDVCTRALVDVPAQACALARAGHHRLRP